MSSHTEEVWIAPCWDTWERDGMTSTSVDPTTSSRAYQHWHLAEEQAQTGTSNDVTRGAVMQKLWNAVDFRVQLLQEIYKLRQLCAVLGWNTKKYNALEVLTRLGLIRPLALLQLKSIRNSVEHADRGAPSREDCLNYVDMVWYFLRSTDVFVTRRVDLLELAPPTRDSGHDRLFVSFDFEEQSWLPEVRGSLPPTAVSMTKQDNYLPVRLMETPQRHTDRVYLRGTFAHGSPLLADLFRRYFLVDLPDNSRAIEGR